MREIAYSCQEQLCLTKFPRPVQIDVILVRRPWEFNPLRANLVGHAADWPWSTAQAHVLACNGRLVQVAAMRAMVNDWRAFLDSAMARRAIAGAVSEIVRKGGATANRVSNRGGQTRFRRSKAMIYIEHQPTESLIPGIAAFATSPPGRKVPVPLLCS